MKNKNCVGIIIFIILVVSSGVFWFFSPKPKPADNALPPTTEQKPADNPVVASTTQSGKIDEHLTINNELRDVNFCGKIYKVKQVMIDGVDVVQRIAEIVTDPKKEDEAICGNVEFSVTRGKTNYDPKNSNELIIYGPVAQNIGTGDLSYSFGIGGILGFDIKYKNMEIETSVAEEGGNTVIGKLK